MNFPTATYRLFRTRFYPRTYISSPLRPFTTTTMVQIPKTQKAAVITERGGELQFRTDYPVTQPDQLKPGECLVKMHCTGVCHTDLHAAKGDWPVPSNIPLIGGHEGVGEIVAIGAYTVDSPVKIGDRVGIKWLANSCLQCEQCRKGLEQNCSKAQLSGYTVDGTFSEYVVSFVAHVTPIPENLKSTEAASILCAGVTVYRALKYSRTNMGDWIVLPGAGGGLGHLAVQYAAAQGLRVIAIDTGADKKELCMKLGAEKWIDFKESKDIVQDVIDAADGVGAHAAVVTSASGEGYRQAVDYLRPGGTMMCVGLPGTAKLEASIFFTVFKSINILGSYVGNRQDAREALAVASAGKARCVYKEQDLSELKNVYKEMEAGKIAGRIVLNMA